MRRWCQDDDGDEDEDEEKMKMNVNECMSGGLASDGRHTEPSTRNPTGVSRVIGFLAYPTF